MLHVSTCLTFTVSRADAPLDEIRCGTPHRRRHRDWPSPKRLTAAHCWPPPPRGPLVLWSFGLLLYTDCLCIYCRTPRLAYTAGAGHAHCHWPATRHLATAPADRPVPFAPFASVRAGRSGRAPPNMPAAMATEARQRPARVQERPRLPGLLTTPPSRTPCHIQVQPAAVHVH